VTFPSRIRATLLAACFSVAALSEAVAQPPRPPSPASELDAFMQKVLARRDVNRQTLKQYILDEAEEFEVLGPGRWPLYRTRREFTWYLRDGVHVRSPLRFNGVGVGVEARDRYEKNWLERERRRAEARAKKEREDSSISVGPGGVDVTTSAIPTEPRFVSEAYFMDFKFDPGNYYVAGREQLEGKEVLRIEYYPTRMFSDDDDDEKGEEKKQPVNEKEKEKEKEKTD
jgi:hypothetical protein